MAGVELIRKRQVFGVAFLLSYISVENSGIQLSPSYMAESVPSDYALTDVCLIWNIFVSLNFIVSEKSFLKLFFDRIAEGNRKSPGVIRTSTHVINDVSLFQSFLYRPLLGSPEATNLKCFGEW